MSIEKFKGSFKSEAQGCTVLINSTIQKITDYSVLGLYVYLCSKPDTWKPNAKELMKHGNCSKDKIYRLINLLIEMGLMSVSEVRKNGRFAHSEYIVHLCPTSPCPENQDTVSRSPCPEKPDPVNQDAYKEKRSSYRRSIEKKDLSFVDSSNTTREKKIISLKPLKPLKSDADYKKNDIFMMFYNAYPKKQKPHDAYKAFLRMELDETDVIMMIDDVKNRRLNDQHWEDFKYIPFPSTYLNSKYWEGDIPKTKEKLSTTRSENGTGSIKTTRSENGTPTSSGSGTGTRSENGTQNPNQNPKRNPKENLIFLPIKTQIQNQLIKHGLEPTQDIVQQIEYYVGQKTDQPEEQTIRVAVSLHKKNQWKIPSGYRGITSQSIATKEDEYQKEKMRQIREDAEIFKSLKSQDSPIIMQKNEGETEKSLKERNDNMGRLAGILRGALSNTISQRSHDRS